MTRWTSVGDRRASASLTTLPVTWYHYPAALIPVAIALAIGRPGARPRLLMAWIVVDLAIAFLPLLWVAVALWLLASTEPTDRITAPAAPIGAQ